MRKKYSRSGLTLVEIVILLLFVGTVVTIGWLIISAHNRKVAVTEFKDSLASIRSSAILCAGDASGLLKSGKSGEFICGGGGAAYPKVSARCGDSPVFYFLDEHLESWRLTTMTDMGGRTPWSCLGCRPVCQASGCSFIETNPGDCY